MGSDNDAKETLQGCIGLILIALIVWAVWPSSDDEEDAPPKVYGTNETVTVKDMSYTVLKAWWADEIGPLRPDASFLLIELRVRNDDKEARAISPSLKLVDEQGAEHSMSAKVWGVKKKTLGRETINPGVQKQGIIVFDVPRKDYKLRVSSGLLAWKEEVLVQLTVGDD